MAHWYWYSIYQFAAGIKSWWGDILWISRRSRSTIWSANTKIQLPESSRADMDFFLPTLLSLHVILDSRKGVSWAEPGSAVDCHRLCRKSIQHRFQIHSTPPHCLGRRLLWANLKRTDLKTNNTKLRWWGLWVLQQERGGWGRRVQIWNHVCPSNPFLQLGLGVGLGNLTKKWRWQFRCWWLEGGLKWWRHPPIARSNSPTLSPRQLLPLNSAYKGQTWQKNASQPCST